MITKFETYNESISSLLVGPTEDEVMDNLKDLSPIEILRKSILIGFLKGVKYAIEQGVDIHYDYDSTLRLASLKGYLDIVKYLVENGADIHAKRDYALRMSSQTGKLDVVKYLVEQGANINAAENYPLKLSAWYGHLDVVKYLVEQGAVIDERVINNAKNTRNIDIINYLNSKMKK